jgi:MoaA/NifB/PqqE/SkfB family radical SAM enzyme
MRCRMCGIWAEEPKTTFDLGKYETMLKQRTLSRLRLVSLTGGEPFALGNLQEFYSLARKYHPKSHINISTNGYYTEETCEFLNRIDHRNASITISYDGIRSHDSIRGVDGAAKILMDTAKQIRSSFPEIALSMKMTILGENSSEILETALQCKEHGFRFLLKTLEKLNCHQSRFPSEIDGPDYNSETMKLIADQARQVLDLGMDTNKHYIKKLLQLNSGKILSCNCSPRILFIGIDGKVFLCRRKESIGNLFHNTLDEIQKSETRIQRVREMKKFHGSPMSLSFTND